MLPQNRAHFPDHSGYVAIAQVNEIALQRRFHIDSIDVQQSRIIFVQHRALDQVLSGGRFQQHRKHTAGASDPSAACATS